MMIKCSGCGAENEAHYRFCLACGSELSKTPQKIADRPSSPSIRPTGPRARLPGLKERLQALRKGRPVSDESVDGSMASENLPGWTVPPAGVDPVLTDSVSTEVAADDAQTDAAAGPSKNDDIQTMAATEPSERDHAQPVSAVESSIDHKPSTSKKALLIDVDQAQNTESTPAGIGADSPSTNADAPPMELSVTDDTQGTESALEGSISQTESLNLFDDSQDAAQAQHSPDDEVRQSTAPEMANVHTNKDDDGVEPALEDPMAQPEHQSLLAAPSPDVSRIDGEAEGFSDDAPEVPRVQFGAMNVSDSVTDIESPSQVEGLESPRNDDVQTAAGASGSDINPTFDSDGIELTRPAMNRDDIMAELQRVGPEHPTEASVDGLDDRPTLVSPVLPDDLIPCYSCGEPQPKEFKFCGACGTRLEHSLTPVPKDGPDTDTREIGLLVLIHPDGSEGEHFSLGDGNLVLGRAHESALFANDQYLSPAHVQFRFQNGWLTIRDLDTRNGVFLKLQADVALSDGDYFRIGQQLLKYEDVQTRLAHSGTLADGTHILGSPTQDIWGKLLCILSQDKSLEEWTLKTPEVYLGRERGTIVFPEDLFVSGSHCRLRRQQGQSVLSDLGSTNGTYLRIKEETALASGDFVLLGQQLFRVDIH